MTTPAVPGLPVPRAAAGSLLLSRYQQTQQSIAVQAALAIVRLWERYVVPRSFADSWAQLNPLVQGIVSTHYDMTAANAAQYYGHARIMAGYPVLPVPGASLDTAQLSTVINSQGAGQFFHYLKEEDADTAAGMAQDSLRGASTRLVLMGGRDTITRASGMDKVARGWERIIEPGACSFCAMLAGRGGVYTSETVSFRAHDHCHCVARPVFPGQKSVNESLSEAWGRETKGTRGAAARTAWDKYWSSNGRSGRAETATSQGEGIASVPHQRIGRTEIPNQAANG